MRSFFAYIRVSTVRQGERGVSLLEQRDAIANYAKRHALEIAEWFEERETAAKRGRAIFTQMLRLLQKGKAKGVIIHKIDRGARNLRDWAELGELIDRGITVHFANENLDLYTRGGRLSADIQAVVAADYIRNLREEVKKGFYGRLKQGLYPLPAPLGYLDRGGGKPKELDPEKSPLVKKVFELYGTGRFSLESLADEASSIGLRTKRGGKLSDSTLSDMFSNPFYMGMIRIKRSNELFHGVHQPIVSKSQFDCVQSVLQGKAVSRFFKHDYLFRLLLACSSCGYSLTGERQKGRIYYRCHTKNCPTTSIREDAVEKAFNLKLLELQFEPEEERLFDAGIADVKKKWETEKHAVRNSIQLNLDKARERLLRLTDAFLDGTIDREMYGLRKNGLLLEQKEFEEKLLEFDDGRFDIPAKLAEYFELAKTAYYQYNLGFSEQKRHLVKNLTSNRSVSGKEVEFIWLPPFKTIAERTKSSDGGPSRDAHRTMDTVLAVLYNFCKEKT